MIYRTYSIHVLYRFYKTIESICVESIIEMMCCLTMNKVLTVMEHADFDAEM